ncbi:bifunctional Delta(1)-pyrroline-2-carboxylate/Delta(1)-piperideine-2-carboxylate reductase [Tenacibaculum sp. IMCC1]|uniref:Ornithine cyclodeaminase family protein n=1 Tax=Tenacibaculum sp. Pbs-1 TaxID=3238748 RepID=A0AB33L2I8_9FLAO|nr:ornithine cyclodeaminase family protein [Tenacibaculum sp. XPcli2-G]MCO7185311.1 ornithine cyclodeaminase family protein [Tenacibaculum sp. XPcli2-G]GFD81306.1 ornithine cyclodeaminase [Tenacibaculum sp. KUL118]
MEQIVQINNQFIESNTSFQELINELKKAFSDNKVQVPLRHHHDFTNPKATQDSTLLLMPAWNPGKTAGIKIVTVSPENHQFNLPAIHGTYILLNSVNGTIKAVLDAKSLTAKRTAAASALASSFLSRKNADSLLMIGTGALATNLIKAHCTVRPIKKVYVWGRNYEKAKKIAKQCNSNIVKVVPVEKIEEKIKEVAIISSATLSKMPLINGDLLQKGQHIDLVGAYKKDMREADNSAILKSTVFVDTFQGGLKESGDIVIPLNQGIIEEKDIKADLFRLCANNILARTSEEEITLFKSVGHALEDLIAANYYYKQYI